MGSCEGGESELQIYGEYVEKYNSEKGFVFDLYEEGGIEETVVTHEPCGVFFRSPYGNKDSLC